MKQKIEVHRDGNKVLQPSKYVNDQTNLIYQPEVRDRAGKILKTQELYAVIRIRPPTPEPEPAPDEAA